VLLDYYVQAVDARGNTNRSDIQHVWVGAGDTSGGGTTNGCNGRVCIAPAPPVQGSAVTISYNPTGGPLAAAASVFLHLGWNNWAVVPPDLAMTFNATSNLWQVTTNIPAGVTQLDCVFNNGAGTWDNNSGADWHFVVASNTTPQPPATPGGLVATPSSNSVALSWSVASGASSYLVNRDGAPIGATVATGFTDSGLASNTTCCYFVVASNSVGLSGSSATVCATTTNLAAPPAPFATDGALDSAGYLLATNGITLYAALRGTKLYVATASPGTSGPNDHFFFVSDALLASPTTAAPWAKSGTTCVAASKPFLSTESLNAYVAWNNAPVSSTVAKSSSTSGVFEGVIDLVEEFGAVPTNLYLCAAAYATADGGTLTAQAPAGSGPNLDPNEFLAIPTAALRDQNADGVFDRVDPALDFRLLSIQAAATDVALSWAAMPGRSYQLESAGVPSGFWSNVSGSLTTAGPLQLELGHTAPLATNPPVQFYRVKLLP
jgi:hypothetical protein